MKHYNIPIFIPEEACPNRCIFCNQKKISGKLKIPTHKDVKNIINKYLKTIDHKKNWVEIAFFGGNFTGIPIKVQESFLKTTLPYIEEKRIRGIRISTRPDYINNQILNILKKYPITTIEIGAQSMDREVLVISKRGHTPEDIKKASKLIRSHGFLLGLQMMIGLPGDSFTKTIDTAKKIVLLQPDMVRVYPTVVVRGTELEVIYRKNQYIPLSIEESLSYSKEVLVIFEEAKIQVIRMGLHPSEGLLNGEDLIAGPFHSSYKTLVLTEIWWDILKKICADKKNKTIVIYTSSGELNYAVGYKKKNKKRLEALYKKVNFKEDKKLKGREFHVSFD